MELKRTIRKILILTLIGLLFFLMSLFYTKSKIPIAPNQLPTTQQLGYGLPIRLIIPKINIDTTIEHVGLTPDGAMDTPKILENVAWFQFGIRPGDIGNAVIDGHYGWKNKKASAFDNLHTLQRGDTLSIVNDQGVSISFVVREIKNYDSHAETKDIFISTDGKSHLNLITCEGTWNKIEKSYSNRLIIFTDKEI